MCLNELYLAYIIHMFLLQTDPHCFSKRPNTPLSSRANRPKWLWREARMTGVTNLGSVEMPLEHGDLPFGYLT